MSVFLTKKNLVHCCNKINFPYLEFLHDDFRPFRRAHQILILEYVFLKRRKKTLSTSVDFNIFTQENFFVWTRKILPHIHDMWHEWRADGRGSDDFLLKMKAPLGVFFLLNSSRVYVFLIISLTFPFQVAQVSFLPKNTYGTLGVREIGGI